MLRSVLRSGGARLAVLPVSAVLGIVATRLIIDHYGTAAYAQYTLLVGIGPLLAWRRAARRPPFGPPPGKS